MKLWGGRFAKKTDRLVEDFQSSIIFDRRLYRQDIQGSIAHARMLGRCGIIDGLEAEQIVTGLEQIRTGLDEGLVQIGLEAEDIHTCIEALLIQRIGEVGKKMHTARSRNDQVALDLRMYLKDELSSLSGLLTDLLAALLLLASKHLQTVMPGYTHLQKAQPVLLSHHLMAYFEMFRRDLERLQGCLLRTDVMPLGSGALAGTTFPLDRKMVAQELGFASISSNSLDAVSDRDFAIEFAAAASLIMVHLSRFCEELVLWSSDEFGFVEMDDAFSTGSSMMPQKKNPDVAELIRGKSGRVFGDLMALLTLMKGLPLAYNKDMQEDKESLFDAVDTVKQALTVFAPLLSSLRFNSTRMREGASRGFTNATDAADYLVKKGVPFREAHAIVGQLVLYCLQQGKSLEELPLSGYHLFSPVFEQDIFEAITIEVCVARRSLHGGPAPESVRAAISNGKKWLSRQQKKR